MKDEARNTARCFIITGMSGTGKTSLIEALRARGNTCFEEPVRRTLMEQLAIDGPALPAKDPRLFVHEMLRRCLSDLEAARSCKGSAFFDRGIPDLAAYAARFGVDTAEFQSAAQHNRYAESVFILPPWREIFVNDEVRRATFEAYEEFHRLIERSYRELGYRLVEVPKNDVEARVKFIEHHVQDMNGS